MYKNILIKASLGDIKCSWFFFQLTVFHGLLFSCICTLNQQQRIKVIRQWRDKDEEKQWWVKTLRPTVLDHRAERPSCLHLPWSHESKSKLIMLLTHHQLPSTLMAFGSCPTNRNRSSVIWDLRNKLVSHVHIQWNHHAKLIAHDWEWWMLRNYGKEGQSF